MTRLKSIQLAYAYLACHTQEAPEVSHGLDIDNHRDKTWRILKLLKHGLVKMKFDASLIIPGNCVSGLNLKFHIS